MFFPVTLAAMFTDKTAVITGGARGIGRATAELLVAGGARVLLADLDAGAVEETAQQLGHGTLAWSGDLTREHAAQDLVATAAEAFGNRLDIVVNNAGYTLDAPVHKLSDDDFQAMLDIHTVVPFRVLRAAAPLLREPAKAERAEGREVFRKVVNVASLAAYGNAGQANYSAAKSGVIGLTKTLAREWGGYKVNVNAVAFGVIDTRLTAPKTDDTTIDINGRAVAVGIPEQAKAAMSAMIALGRPGTAQEAAGGIAFLCSPWSDYVTGQVLNVSGGIAFGMGA
jgi:3-oxoacyl-[acyl-carrier protein] reductase